MKRKVRIGGSGEFTEMWYATGMGVAFEPVTRVHREHSRFQKIEVYKTKTHGYLAVFDGQVMLTSAFNHLYHEMMVHTVLSPNAKDMLSVLVIGGGDCGAMREVLKYRNVRTAHQVEIDDRVTPVCEKFFPELCAPVISDWRATLVAEDGIKWVRHKDRREMYDVIIVDSTEPEGMAKGLFGTSFYRNCMQVLKRDGMLVTQTGSPLFSLKHIRQVSGNMLKAGFKDVATITFPQPDYPSGYWSATIAAKLSSIARQIDGAFVPETKYYNAEVHAAAFAVPQFMRE